ncbi:hypothetical protein [Burkholderia phage FLC8]|nr:hypothetical protein [Burkholderia phage FLC8]
MNDKTKIITPLFDPKMHDELTEACRNSIPEQIMKDWGGGFKKGEMVIFSTPGPTPFVPRDPDIHRGRLYPLIVHPVTERKSMMALNEAIKAGLTMKISLEMPEVEVLVDRNISEEGMEMLKQRANPIAIDCQMNPDGSLSFGVVPPDADHPALMEVGGYSDKFKGPDFNPNRPEALPYVGECLTGRLKPTNVPMTRGEGDPLNLHRKYQVGKLRPEHKLDPILQEVLEKEPGMKKEKNNE